MARGTREQYQDRKLDQVDGIKIDLGNEWVLILPDPDGPFFHIIAEGSSEEQAQVLTEKYAGLVTAGGNRLLLPRIEITHADQGRFDLRMREIFQ